MSISYPNLVLVEIILSISEYYLKVYYDVGYNIHICVVFGVILPLAEHDWLK